ncbi:MAG: trigger factor [Candidatus Caccosoma sp.]|nr:trigger factor [Candidatus Caccosoma sp.]
MQLKLETLKEKCEVHFNAKVDGEEWKAAQDRALKELALNVTVKGFRKGKAPLAQAVKYINPNQVVEKAADKAVQKAYVELSKEDSVVPFLQPELVVNELTADAFSFTFVIVTSPVIELGEYKGIAIDKKPVRVLKADIDNELKSMALKNAELVVADNNYEAKKNDTVVIDFKGFIDGKEFEGGEAKGYELELGSNTFIPGFEDQLIGAKTNEDRKVEIQFPENYVAGFAGKKALFEVHVNAVKEKRIPAIDDDFAKDLDIEGVDNLEQLTAHVKEQLKDRKTKQADHERLEELLTKILDNATFTCHDKILKKDSERIIKDFTNRLEQQGLSINDYLNMSKKTMEDLEKEAKEESLKNSKRAFMFEKVAELENINVTNEEVDAKLSEIAKQYNATLDDLKKQLGNQIGSFTYNLKQEKVIDFLKANNNL